MANEITVSLTVGITSGDYQDSFRTSYKANQTTLGGAAGIAVIGTSEENLSLTDVSSPGIVVLQNLDSLNFCLYGCDNSGMQSMGKLKAGEVAFFRYDPAKTLRLKADTANVKIRYWVLSD